MPPRRPRAWLRDAAASIRATLARTALTGVGRNGRNPCGQSMACGDTRERESPQYPGE